MPSRKLLYVDGQAAGVIEANKEGTTLAGVEVQAEKYAAGVPEHLPAEGAPAAVPFTWCSTVIVVGALVVAGAMSAIGAAGAADAAASGSVTTRAGAGAAGSEAGVRGARFGRDRDGGVGWLRRHHRAPRAHWSSPAPRYRSMWLRSATAKSARRPRTRRAVPACRHCSSRAGKEAHLAIDVVALSS